MIKDINDYHLTYSVIEQLLEDLKFYFEFQPYRYKSFEFEKRIFEFRTDVKKFEKLNPEYFLWQFID